MQESRKIARTRRVRAMNNILTTLYPNPNVALNHSNVWELLVAVILSAQCTDERVNAVTKDLFKKYPTIVAYNNATQEEMEKAVHSCGFFRNKAKSIREAAHTIRTQFCGEVPHTMEELLTISGVGRKTANIILSNAFNIHEGIAVDTHVRRFSIRFDLTDYTDPIRIEQDLKEIVPMNEWMYFNHRLIQYGREYCPARMHDCTAHPLTKIYVEANYIWPKAH